MRKRADIIQALKPLKPSSELNGLAKAIRALARVDLSEDIDGELDASVYEILDGEIVRSAEKVAEVVRSARKSLRNFANGVEKLISKLDISRSDKAILSEAIVIEPPTIGWYASTLRIDAMERSADRDKGAKWRQTISLMLRSDIQLVKKYRLAYSDAADVLTEKSTQSEREWYKENDKSSIISLIADAIDFYSKYLNALEDGISDTPSLKIAREVDVKTQEFIGRVIADFPESILFPDIESLLKSNKEKLSKTSHDVYYCLHESDCDMLDEFYIEDSFSPDGLIFDQDGMDAAEQKILDAAIIVVVPIIANLESLRKRYMG